MIIFDGFSVRSTYLIINSQTHSTFYFICSMFATSCKRLRIMKGAEARGLGCGVWEKKNMNYYYDYDMMSEKNICKKKSFDVWEKSIIQLLDFESRYPTTMPSWILKGYGRLFLQKLCQHFFFWLF
jgi:hypothetical protein